MGSDPLAPPGERLLSIAMPLDIDVTDKVKASIWALDFIDLSKLKDQTDQLPIAYDIDITSPGGTEKLRINQNRNPKPFEHISQWFEAFHIYLTILCQKFPQDNIDMLCYQYTIKSIATEGGDWQRYDTQFRKLFKGKRVPWNKPHTELYIKCMRRARDTFPARQQFNSQPNKSNKNQRGFRGSSFFARSTSNTNQFRHPKGHCFDYHDTGRCSRAKCSFAHKCYSPGCTAIHPVIMCPKSANTPMGYVRSRQGSNNSSGVSSNNTVKSEPFSKPTSNANANKASRS